jgi:hypothetical protein
MSSKVILAEPWIGLVAGLGGRLPEEDEELFRRLLRDLEQDDEFLLTKVRGYGPYVMLCCISQPWSERTRERTR